MAAACVAALTRNYRLGRKLTVVLVAFTTKMDLFAHSSVKVQDLRSLFVASRAASTLPRHTTRVHP